MEIKACRICLNVNVKMHCLEDSALRSLVENLFKSEGYTQKLKMNHIICFECNGLLRKFYNFTQKALRAQNVLYELKKNKKLKNILHLDRKTLGINSPLSCHKVNIDFFIEESVEEDKTNLTVNDEFENKCDLIQVLDENKCTRRKRKKLITKASQNKLQPHFNTENNIEPESDIDSEMSVDTKSLINDSSTGYENKPIKKETTTTRRKSTEFYYFISESEEEKRTHCVISKENIVSGKRKRKIKKIEESNAFDDVSSSSDKSTHKPKQNIDINYEPVETSSESESPYDSYDDEGKRLLKPKDDRVYPMKCDHCDFVVEKRTLHYVHYIFSHTGEEFPYLREKRHMCYICGYKTQTHSKLRQHELTHGEKTVKCTECDAMFHNRKIMLQHSKSVHPKVLLICDYCQRPFKTRRDLQLHIRTHTGEKPFKCHICGEGFAHKGNVGIHIRNRHQHDNLRQTKTKAKKKTKTKTNSKSTRKLRKKKSNNAEDVISTSEITNGIEGIE